MSKRTAVEVEDPKLSNLQRQQLVVNEVMAWINGRFVNEIILEIARKLKDGPVVEATADELKKSAPVIEELKREYFSLSGKERSFEIPDQVKIQVLEREILARAESEYVLELRSRAAEKAGNKEMAKAAVDNLSKVIGYLDGFKKALREVRKRVEKESNTALNYTPQKAN